MPRKAKDRKLIVANPNAIPLGTPILSYKDGPDFYEGDEFIPRIGTTEEIIQRRIQEGYLIEA